MTTEPAPPKIAEIVSFDSAEVKGLVVPLVTPEEAKKRWKQFEALKAELLGDEDYQSISGKRYIKRSGFRKLSVFFGLSDRIVKEERVDRREDSSFVWRIIVEVIAPNGRTCIGVGACDSKERKFSHPEHDVWSTCHTRAKSRAISDMVAGGVVSAEEMDSNTYPQPQENVPKSSCYSEMPWEPYPSDPQNGWIFANMLGVEWLLDELLKAPERRIKTNIEGRDYELSLGYDRDDKTPKFIRRVLLKEATQ